MSRTTQVFGVSLGLWHAVWPGRLSCLRSRGLIGSGIASASVAALLDHQLGNEYRNDLPARACLLRRVVRQAALLGRADGFTDRDFYCPSTGRDLDEDG